MENHVALPVADDSSVPQPIEYVPTPRPWRVAPVSAYRGGEINIDAGANGLGGFICTTGLRDDPEAIGNAHLIVHAVNRDHHFDDLVKALEAATGILETLTDPKSQHVSSQHIWAQSVEAASKNRSLLSRLKSEG